MILTGVHRFQYIIGHTSFNEMHLSVTVIWCREELHIRVFREKYTDDEIGAQIPIYMLGTPALISCIFRNSYGVDMSVICVFREK